MKKLLLTIMCLWLVLGAMAADPDTLISFHCSNLPFNEFCSEIHAKYGVRIYYRNDWIRDVKVTVHAERESLLNIVESALKGTRLKVSAWNQDMVILPGTRLPETLPLFLVLKSRSDNIVPIENSLTRSEERYLTGRKADVMKSIQVGKRGLAAPQSMVTLRGRITDAQSGEPLIGATLYLEEPKTGAATDKNGFLTHTVKPGTYSATFSSMGFEPAKYQLEVLSGGEFAIEMRKSVIQMDEVVVFGDRQMNIQRKDPGLEKLSAKAIKQIPMMMGERDILKVSEMLPGIVSVGEGSSGLNVRGGNYDQNAFYLNRIPIYNPTHVNGFFPAFNNDIIKDFSIYKGHIPANFGGRLSSVFNIIARQGNRKQFTARGGISPITASIVAEGPLKKDKASFLLSSRMLYSDWILRKINDPTIRTSKAGFHDGSLSLDYDLHRSQISLFAYHSYDQFRLSDLNEFTYSNDGLSAEYGISFHPELRGEFALTAANYAFKTKDQQEPSAAYQYNYSIREYIFNAEFSHVIHHAHTLEYGAGATLYLMDRGSLQPYGNQSIKAPVEHGNEQGIESGLYLSDTWEPLKWLNLTAGIRLAMFRSLGPADVVTYTEGNPRDIRYISDTLHFNSGKAIKSDLEPDIRAALNIVTDRNGTVKIAFNQMHQNLFVLNNTTALSPNAQWKLADYYLKPASSSQLSLGVFRTINRLGLEASVEAYVKHILRYPEFVDGADFLSNALVETTILPGKQETYGLEFMFKRNGKRLEGWIAYTYSRSRVQVRGTHPWENINNGNVFPANYDIPHVINTVVNYHFTRRITASAVLTYQAGKPVTYPVSVFYIQGIPYVEYSARNAYRIPDYFRMDLSLTLEGNLRRNKPLHNSLVVSLYNATGRENPYSVYFTLEKGRIKSYQYAVIGVPIFTVTWLFKLGNYASD